MKEEFPEWFGSHIRQRHADNDKDPEVSTTSELFALACGLTWTPISINSCVVDGVRYVMHYRDDHRTTQNSGICLPGPDGEMYYGQLQEILEFKDLINVDDVGVRKQMLHGPTEVTVAVDDHPHHTLYPRCQGAALIKGKRKLNLGGKGAGQPHKAYLSAGQRSTKASTCTLQKAYNTNKASFKAKHWKADPTPWSYDVDGDQAGARPRGVYAAEWDKYIKFWNDPKTLLSRSKSAKRQERGHILVRDPESLARLRNDDSR
ncbi:hypothetical protein Tco_1217888 [Tanacetum coccineum]